MRLLQGAAVGLGLWFTKELRDDERHKIRNVAGLNDMPFTIVSIVSAGLPR